MQRLAAGAVQVGERIEVNFDEFFAPHNPPFSSAGVSFTGNAQVWDSFFGLNHAQVFGDQGTPPNFLLTNLSARIAGPMPADGLSLIPLSACGENGVINLQTLDAQGGQVDYLAVDIPAGAPQTLRLASLRLFQGLQLTGAEHGALCNLAFDDLTLIRTHLFMDDFEAGATTAAGCGQTAAEPSWVSEEEGCRPR